MSEPATTLLFGLDKLDMLLKMYTRDFNEAHWKARPGGELHSGHWILAHLALSLNQETGREIVFGTELDKALDYGAPVEERPEDWPDPDTLLLRHEEGLAALRALWMGRGQEEWQAPVGENRLGIANQAQSAMFVLVHALYHVGQLGAIRRLLGLKGVV
ncbi:MAG: DinB family protein [bacterium]|jgi:uncharacterized damage-inducible protein DinB|nr:DinB family protein [bacterium]